MVVLNKLVRDKVPMLVTKDGGRYSLQLLSPTEHQSEITKKMFEELQEYSEATSTKNAVEELVDLVELVHASLKLQGISLEDFEAMREQKRKKKGGFDQGIFLNEINQ